MDNQQQSVVESIDKITDEQQDIINKVIRFINKDTEDSDYEDSDSEDNDSDDEWDYGYGIQTISEVKITMAGGGAHWWNYIISSNDGVYIENTGGRMFQYGKRLIFHTERESYRLVSDDYETDDDDIIFIDYDMMSQQKKQIKTKQNKTKQNKIKLN